MKKLKNSECRLRIVFVTGTIKKLQEKSFLRLKSSNQKLIYKLANDIKKHIIDTN